MMRPARKTLREFTDVSNKAIVESGAQLECTVVSHLFTLHENSFLLDELPLPPTSTTRDRGGHFHQLTFSD